MVLETQLSLFPIYRRLPKLDAEGSNPFSRSIFSITCANLTFCGDPLFEVTRFVDVQNPLTGLDLKY